MGFRVRLASFLVATLALVQFATAALVYGVTRGELVGEGGRQLAVAADAFARQLDGVAERLVESVQVLSQDYALRSAVAQHEHATLLSAMRNHGRRVGAARMLLLDLDGVVRADTADAGYAGAPFRYASLFERARKRSAASLAASEDRAYWMVLAPVHAPDLIGVIAAEIPVDERILAQLREQSALPHELELVAARGASWVPLTQRRGGASLVAAVMGGGAAPPREPIVVEADGREFVALAKPLSVAPESAPVTAVFGYSLDAALQPYRSVGMAWAGVLALGLAAALAGAVLIAGGVSRPLEALATAARRIAAGDYRPPEAVAGAGEISQLGTALTNMARAIGEREARIRHQAGHDAVTDLPNRVTAEATIQRGLGGPVRDGALLLVGLPRLAEITKTIGHAIADRLIRDVAGRLRAAVDGQLLARATDNEIALWLPGADQAAAVSAAFRLLGVLAEPYREAELAIDIHPSAGIALFPAHGAQASTLLQRAEVALFAALGSADAVAVYDPATDPHRPERLMLMGDLRAAIERDELRLHYQPRLDIARGIVDGAEGLVRWQHPHRGMIPPDAFIGLAEETGNIRRLTRWALVAGVAQARQWSERGWDLRVAVNVSARDLDDADLPQRVDELLSAHRVPAHRLMIEITESAVMARPDAALQVLRRLADRGVDLAIDDFGVGQSSLAYLHRLPVRELKIDRAFLKDVSTNVEDQAIVRSIVELGQRLGYRVTAEGVESAAALEFLAGVGCDHAQGYHIAAALPAAGFEAFYAGRVRPPHARVS